MRKKRLSKERKEQKVRGLFGLFDTRESGIESWRKERPTFNN